MDLKEVLQYQTADGKVPFREWFLELDLAVKARIRTRIDRLKLGNFGDCKSVGNGVFELRFHFGSGYRIYFGQLGKTIVILLCGGDKSTQSKDVKLAHTYWEDYRRRKTQ